MLNKRFYTLKPDKMKPLELAVVASANSPVVSVKTARTVEVWIELTNGAAGDFDFQLQAAIATAGPFVNVGTPVLNRVTDGIFAIVVNRADHALGTDLRLAYTANAGQFDIEAQIVRLE